MKTRHVLGVAVVCVAVCLVGAGDVPASTVQTGFYDDLTTYNTTIWRKSAYNNGSPFGCAFVKNNVTHSAGKMNLQITQNGASYSCAEYQTVQEYGYGTYSARLKASNEPGVVTAFFVHHGDWGQQNHHEIDFEILGQNPWQVQLNYFAYGDGVNGENEILIDLDFDASADYHTYTFEWKSGGVIVWYIDGEEVANATFVPFTKPPVKLQVSLWNVDNTLAAWAGTFTYPGTPVQAWVDWIEFIKEPKCLTCPSFPNF